MIKKLIKRVLSLARGKSKKSRIVGNCTVIPFKEHGVKREGISSAASRVTDGLQAAGFQAYVVGGAVRDLLLKRQPKDFDVATDATPEEVRRVFRRARIIGRRFRLVHVMFGDETVEVSTFRRMIDAVDAQTDDHGRLLRDNEFGDQEQDAARRDFTANALFFDPSTQEIFDFHHGYADVRANTLRMIGDPATRYREDPVRMLRAARFAAKLDFHIDPDTRKPVAELAPLLANIPRSRIFEEAVKLLMSGHALRAVHQLRAEGLHHGMLPMLDTILDDPQGKRFIEAGLHNTDQRIAQDKSTSPAFLFACLLWPQVARRWKELVAGGEKPIPALFTAMDVMLEIQREQLAIPRRHDGMIKEIWALQPRFEQRAGSRPFRLLEHPRFRAGYDFLLLRAESGEVAQELGDWWTEFQDASDDTRADMLVADSSPKPKRRRKRKSPSAADVPDGDNAE